MANNRGAINFNDQVRVDAVATLGDVDKRKVCVVCGMPATHGRGTDSPTCDRHYKRADGKMTLAIPFGALGFKACLASKSPEEWLLVRMRVALKEDSQTFARRAFEEALDVQARIVLAGVAKLAKEQGKVPKTLTFEVRDMGAYRD